MATPKNMFVCSPIPTCTSNTTTLISTDNDQILMKINELSEQLKSQSIRPVPPSEPVDTATEVDRPPSYPCPPCSTNTLCAGLNCSDCIQKSFASHEKSQYWSARNGSITPRQLLKTTSNKHWFDCNSCSHSFEAKINSIVSGKWCPHCTTKTEQKLYTTLLPLYPNVVRQFKQEWCKHVRQLPFDFCLPDDKIIIELDGAQHFRQVRNWSPPQEIFDNDKFKETCANENNYSTIRLLQEDVWGDIYNWKKELCDAIEEIKRGDDVTNIYLCKKQEYACLRTWVI